MPQPSYNAVITAEYRLLNSLIKKPEYFDDSRVTEDIFVDETAKSIYQAISTLREGNIEVTPASLYQAGSGIDYNVTRQSIDAIFEIDEEGASSLDDIVEILNETKTKNRILSEVETIRQNLVKPGNLDVSDIQGKLYSITDELEKKGTDSPLINFQQWADDYIEELKERKKGKKYSFGDILLDQQFVRGAEPGCITTIAGSTGSGKSYYTLNIINNLINRNIPCMYLSLEMSSTATFDRLIALRCGINSRDLYDAELADSIIEAVEGEKQALEDNTNFYFCQEPDINMAKLRAMIREFKQRTKQDYAFVAIDLLTMIREFASVKGNMAQSIEVAMNELSVIAKAENVHIWAVVQLNRESDNVKIHTVEGLDELRPSLGGVKNSNAINERSRIVLALFHPKSYSDKYLVPIGAPGAEDIEDYIEVQVLKNSNGMSGAIMKYNLIPEQFKMLPVMEEDKDEEIELDF